MTERAALALILSAAFLWRLGLAIGPAYWIDEAMALVFFRMPLPAGDVFWSTSSQLLMPLWGRLVPADLWVHEWILRLPAVGAGTTLALVIWLAARDLGAGGRLVAAAIAAFAWPAVRMGAEAKGQGLLLVAVPLIFAITGAWPAPRPPRRWALAAATLGTLAAGLLAPVVAAIAVTAAYLQRRRVGFAAVGVATATVILALIFRHALTAMAAVGQFRLDDPLYGAMLAESLRSSLSLHATWSGPALAVALAMGLYSPTGRRAAAVAALTLTGTVAAIIVTGIRPADRYFVALWPFLWLAVAAGVRATPRGAVAMLAIAVWMAPQIDNGLRLTQSPRHTFGSADLPGLHQDLRDLAKGKTPTFLVSSRDPMLVVHAAYAGLAPEAIWRIVDEGPYYDICRHDDPDHGGPVHCRDTRGNRPWVPAAAWFDPAIWPHGISRDVIAASDVTHVADSAPGPVWFLVGAWPVDPCLRYRQPCRDGLHHDTSDDMRRWAAELSARQPDRPPVRFAAGVLAIPLHSVAGPAEAAP